MPQMYTWRGKACALGLSAALAFSYTPLAFADEEESDGNQGQFENIAVEGQESDSADAGEDVLENALPAEEAAEGNQDDGEALPPSAEEESVEETASDSGAQVVLLSDDGSAAPVAERGDTDAIASGTIGNNGTWSVTADGVLTIGGTGVVGQGMYTFPYEGSVSPSAFPNGITVVVEEGVTGLGPVLFAEGGFTADVNEVKLPSTLVSVDEEALFGNVKSYTGDSPLIKDGCLFADEDHTVLLAMPRDGASYRIPEGTVTFGEYASASLPDVVEYLYVPSSLTSIYIPGKNSDPKTVKRVECSPDNKVYHIETDPSSAMYGSLVTIEENRFGGHDYGVKVTIETYVQPDTNVVYTADKKVLLSADGETGNVVVLDGCESIGSSAFSGCSDLTSITLPSSVTSIGNYAFSNCMGLTSVTLPEGLVSIGQGAFSGCSSLKEIGIPDSVTSIGKGAFSGTALAGFTAPGSLWAGTDSTQHTQDPMNPDTLFVSGTPDEIGTPDWKDDNGNPKPYAESIKNVDLSNYTANFIPAYMFMGLTGLESVAIPADVRNVMSGAFYGCTNLKDVYVLGTNTNIQGFGTAGSEVSSFDIDLYPAFAYNKWNGQDWVPCALSLNLYGLAYGNNPVISYAAENNSTFIPFVVLETGVAQSKDLFGYEVTGYNDVKIADMVYTGEELTPQIMVSFTDRTDGGVADRELVPGVDCNVTYKDAGGNTVTSIVAPGTYTAQIIGNDIRGVIGTQNVTFRVVDPNEEPAVDPGAGQQGQQTSGRQTPGQQLPGGQQLLQQAGYQPGGMAMAQQGTALSQTGDTVDTAPVAAVAVTAAAAAALAGTMAARKRMSGQSRE